MCPTTTLSRCTRCARGRGLPRSGWSRSELCSDAAPFTATYCPHRRDACATRLSYALDMARLDYVTAGESHGAGMVVIVSGMPAGVPVDEAFINAELTRRQGGYGRGGRGGGGGGKVGGRA